MLNYNNTIKKVTGNDKIKKASTKIINEAVTATKTKSWKRFAFSLLYFLLTIGAVILSSIFPDNQAINRVYEYVSNTDNLAFITMITGGYITGQTLTDILFKKK
jgi:hypothetical protein